jgi:hypothetical protein
MSWTHTITGTENSGDSIRILVDYTDGVSTIHDGFYTNSASVDLNWLKGQIAQKISELDALAAFAAAVPTGTIDLTLPAPVVPTPPAPPVVMSVNADATGKALPVQLDSDGAPMSRVKVAPSGWSFNLRGFQFQLSTLGSLINIDASGNSLGDVTLTLYDASGTVITDPSLQSNCVKTVIDFEPTCDYYIAGGLVDSVVQATQSVHAFAIGAPDIPANYGGSKMFIQNVDVACHPAGFGVQADGRAPKWLQYSATLHTSKMRFLFMHAAGYQLGMNIELETYVQ